MVCGGHCWTSGWRVQCASPFRRSSAGGSCGRLTAGHSLCHAPGLRSVGETLPCRARPHGTVSPSNCGRDFISAVFPHVSKKTQKSFIRLLAPMKPFVQLALYEGRSISSENQYIRLKYFSQVIYHWNVCFLLTHMNLLRMRCHCNLWRHSELNRNDLER